LRSFLYLMLVAGVALVTAAPAHGHANFERADPIAGDVLQQSPPALRLWFTEPLEAGFSEVQVLDGRGTRVDRGDSRIVPNDRTSMVVSLPVLPRGSYSVAWRALSAVDGHVTRGVYSLLIGVAPAVEIAPPPPQIYPTTPYEVVVRWLGYLATAALLGAASFLLFVFQPAAGPRQQTSLALARLTTRIGWAAWIFLVIAAVGSFAVQLIAVGGSVDGRESSATVTQLLQTRYGVVWITRLGLIAVIGALMVWLPRRPRLWRIVASAGSVLLLTTALNSHGAAAQGWLPLISDWIHLLAGAIWVGGLFTFAMFLWWMARTNATDRADLVARLVPAFSTLAFGCVALLTATGSYLTWVHVGGWLPFWETLYGQSLAIKLSVVVPLVALGAVNLLLIRPKLVQMRIASVIRLVEWLRRTVTVESALGVVVMLVAAMLTSLPPAGQIYPMIAASRPFTLVTVAGGLRIVFTASPGRPGPNVLLVQLSEGGRPVAGAERVDLRFTFQDQPLGTAIERLRPQGDGRYAVRSAALGIAGLWQVELLVRLPGRDDILTGFRVRALASGLRSDHASTRFRVPPFLTRIGDLFRGRRDVRTLRNPIVPTPEALEIGGRIYLQHCAVCHGTDGSGKGPAAATLSIPPADFRVHMAAGHTDGELFRWVSNGVTGTAMPAFRRTLSEEERWYVIAYIRSTFTPADK
jgi:copper transport protein